MDNIRNFVIISHVDHGKSTLADRFLELTGTVDSQKMRPQYLDMMDLEREKGITIKMQPVRMNYTLNAIPYILNLIDTPGHIDFSYEVSRSLSAVEGAILLVDATKGIQAQTIGNLELAKNQGLVIIPAINKIDLPQARIEETEKEVSDLLSIDPREIIKISAKCGTNIEKILQAIIKKIPPPSLARSSNDIFRALIFDSKYDSYKGIIAYCRIFDGEIKEGEKIYLIQGEVEGEAKEVGVFSPELTPRKTLKAGEIGYIATGIKEPGKLMVGDTIISLKLKAQSSKLKSEISNLVLPGYKEPKPMVFLSIYPENSDDFDLLKEALGKLKLNDAALVFKPELREGLGRGFQCGFLGVLHAEIIAERLKREFGLGLVLSTPSVVYKVITRAQKDFLIYTPQDFPKDLTKIKEIQECWARLRILTPLNYLGKVSELLESIESQHIETRYLGVEKAELIYETPLREIITKNLYDKLKGTSQGFASMNYEILDKNLLAFGQARLPSPAAQQAFGQGTDIYWRTVNLVKLEILILGKKEETLSKIVPEKEAYKEGKRMVEKLKEVLPHQLFSVPLQAVVGGKIIARETIRARGRDVIAPLYGGDYTRKRKLLERQKKGKKELKEKGRIRIPPEVYLKILG
ncbi:MAG: elongation factor 4 [Candidatus Nealsonbacteria bacterium CG_4_9_14_0_2_um_filter_37_38]|uniref:Elongation factor 4 n=1 Tax=Candidatus Nealsonbacteria bacterium CG_4_10_14_0_8_um_filter_37_14 TaxID=1974684 RepID=A0A2M7R7H0_9BACT|nr:MAG: elongation factor 4 [Candidatus Nealsonbacteria bacterium CG11_big_fil_rev_8_21_14_0_20_37_68]PIW91808.1 MAG: elongation factor 4 [Candidatus Nealsonbacteria bacterium CG_4_8_14_3_um_filter_37_23]PIY89475.1 MAG: elongation factor 4 [Candidatus Nealsonbacteria bacterium CG_4_10_14_0_8_um_filter_37_14]PJC51505.1 MAG: elongation factor 4 [Candidatus Nealsonbacteria bacterium CG_4_9_14_0_2_um_filter_37_38]